MSAKKQRPAKAAKEFWNIRIEATPARKRIIKELRQMNFRAEIWTEHMICAAMAQLAFMVPERISSAASFVARYQNAEGSTPIAWDQITNTVAASFRKEVSNDARH